MRPGGAGLRLALSLGLGAGAAGAALAKVGTPGLDYFAGYYERIGRDGSEPPGLIDDVVRLQMQGDRIEALDCEGNRLRLIHDPSFDYSDRLIGDYAGRGIDCQFHNNGENRPLLTCMAREGPLFTLWPIDGKSGPARAACAE